MPVDFVAGQGYYEPMLTGRASEPHISRRLRWLVMAFSWSFGLAVATLIVQYGH
jgi:hypothetical protein